ncbi:MAG: hypothetical protein LBG26_06025 [Treponema sp.]|nr:hypothetical protein [Treponema sp.]
MSFNGRFVNEAGTDLVSGKIHTLRQNFAYWKNFEGRDIKLFVWEGKPYRSSQKVFCIRHIFCVQKVWHKKAGHFYKDHGLDDPISMCSLSYNDGFRGLIWFMDWFGDYPDGEMTIVHFTDFQY